MILPKKIDLFRQFITARGAESEVVRTGRIFSSGGARLKKGGAYSANPP